MFHKLIYNLFLQAILFSIAINSVYSGSTLFERSEMTNIYDDAAKTGITINSEIEDLLNQLDDLNQKKLKQIEKIEIAGDTHTPHSSLIKKLQIELSEIEKNIFETENNFLKACMRFSIEIADIDQEIENRYSEALINFKPTSNEFKNIEALYLASKRIRHKFQVYQVMYQARQTLTSRKSTLFDCITAYARLLFIDPGNREAIKYCQSKLRWNDSDDSIFVLDNIDQLSSDTIITLYNNGIEITKPCSLDIELSWIPPGSYTKPSINTPGTIKKKLEPDIIITRGFWLSRHEITVSQYLKFLNSTRTFDKKEYFPLHKIEPESLNFRLDNYNCYQLTDDFFLGNPNNPMIMVSYNDAVEFCKWISDMDGLTYNLPTESQWELAARANVDTMWYFGDDISLLDQYGWYNKFSRISTKEVGQLRPNLFGLYDLYGNVWEWCQDWYHEQPFLPGKAVNPKSIKLSNTKVIRGGSWQSNPSACSSFGRNSATPNLRDKAIGFRIIQETQ